MDGTRQKRCFLRVIINVTPQKRHTVRYSYIYCIYNGKSIGLASANFSNSSSVVHAMTDQNILSLYTTFSLRLLPVAHTVFIPNIVLNSRIVAFESF
jgi:hypothetical protein